MCVCMCIFSTDIISSCQVVIEKSVQNCIAQKSKLFAEKFQKFRTHADIVQRQCVYCVRVSYT